MQVTPQTQLIVVHMACQRPGQLRRFLTGMTGDADPEGRSQEGVREPQVPAAVPAGSLLLDPPAGAPQMAHR